MTAAPRPHADEMASLRPLLYRFAMRALREREVAGDLVQDTLAAAVAQQGQFEGRSSLRTWALGILSHKIIDELRRRGVELTDGSDSQELLERPSAEDLERVVAARRDLARVEVALGALPHRERLAILLVDVEGLDRDAVCSTLAITATHLRVVLHRGRNRLRRLLEHA